MPVRENNFKSPNKEKLGKLLFFDPLLSGDNNFSCAHCHHPDLGFTDNRALSMGHGGSGIGPKRINDVIVVFKSYLTRVGTGPMTGELSPEKTSEKGWEEFGTVTGRLRRAAEFDFELANRAIMLSSANQISITKLDVRFPNSAGTQSIDDLDSEAKSFIKNIEDKLGVPVTLIGTGAGVNDVIDLRT